MERVVLLVGLRDVQGSQLLQGVAIEGRRGELYQECSPPCASSGHHHGLRSSFTVMDACVDLDERSSITITSVERRTILSLPLRWSALVHGVCVMVMIRC